MKNKTIKLISKHILFLIIIAVFIYFNLRIFNGCAFRYFTSLPCPACGSSRAIVALLRGNIKGYFHFNPFALPLGFLMIGFAHYKYINHIKLIKILLYLTGVSALIFNFFRIINIY